MLEMSYRNVVVLDGFVTRLTAQTWERSPINRNCRNYFSITAVYEGNIADTILAHNISYIGIHVIHINCNFGYRFQSIPLERRRLQITALPASRNKITRH